jgi:preprotein translocase subunit SecF
MQWLTRTPNFNFVKYRRVAMVTSSILSVLALVSLFYPGLNYGIDFTGGTIVEAAYESPANLDAIRSDLAEAGFESVQVQNFGSANDVLIRLPPAEGEDSSDPDAVNALQDRVLGVLRSHDENVEVRGTATVGAQVGEDLFENAGLALLFALILVFVYVMLRFRWKLAVGAIVATLHDVLVTTGIFALAATRRPAGSTAS